MIKVESFDFSNKIKFNEALAIRKQVFVIEQGIDENLEYDGYDSESKHYVAYFSNVPIGTARWRNTETGIKFERFAVLSEYRNKNIGKLILCEALKDTVKLNKTIYLNAQITAVNFYLKNKFVKVGDYFLEAEIKHIKMEYKK